MRESFIIYRSFFALIKLLPDKKQVKMFTAIFEYGLDEKEPNFDGEETMKAIWSAIKPQLKANNKRYANGKRGGAPVGNSNAEKQPSVDPKNNLDPPEKTTKTIQNKTTEKQPNENENENENVNVNNNKNINIKSGEQVAVSQVEKFKKFIKPAIEEIQAFCSENNYNVDANRFYDFYESKGWLVGKTKMKEWKSAVRGWESRNNQTAKSNASKPKQSMQDVLNKVFSDG